MPLPTIEWATLTNDELAELILAAEAEEQRRWYARRPRSLVDELRACIDLKERPRCPESP